MAFRFSLDTLLRVRAIKEQREERLLGQILNQIAHTRQTLGDLQRQRVLTFEQREAALREQISAIEISRYYQVVQAIEDLQRSGAEQLAKLEALRDQQMKIYKSAHRDQELLTSLREKQLAHFQQEQMRKDQAVMDDNFSTRQRFK